LITSSQNPKVQRLRALFSQRKEREVHGEFPVEGVRLFEEALTAGWKLRQALYTPELSQRGMELIARCRALGAEVEEVDPRVLKAAADTESPQGLVGVFAQRTLPLPVSLDFMIVADGLRDPGNLGTLLRTAAAAGAQAVLLTPGSVDPYSPKVLRAAMGAHFRLPVLELSWEELSQALKPACRVYAAGAGTGTVCWELDLRGPLALVIGAEAEGIGPQMSALADGVVRIPMPGQTESLNAAVAAGILLFEVVRQRRG
jgi:RNA methyltransferase, TrmH family